MDRRSSLDRFICIDRSCYCNLLNVMLAHTAILLKVFQNNIIAALQRRVGMQDLLATPDKRR
ncbi:MAG: hypothetical protein HOB45_01145 [Planctomycetaceae bacterium]|nr:hypothetical protein [Planctomycetaceae bacterium]